MDAAEEALRALQGLVDEVGVLPEGSLTVTRLRAAKYRLRVARDAAAGSTRGPPAEGTRNDATRTRTAARTSDDEEASEEEEEASRDDDLTRETARSLALARATRGVLDFWTGLANDPSGATRLLHRMLCVALRGQPGVLDSARELASRYAKTHVAATAAREGKVGRGGSRDGSGEGGSSGEGDGDGDGTREGGRGSSGRPRLLTHAEMHGASESMVRWQSATNFGTGFAVGIGGLVTLPVTVPAALAASVVTSLRLAFAVAIVGGHDPMQPHVAAAAITAALGIADGDEGGGGGEDDPSERAEPVGGEDCLRAPETDAARKPPPSATQTDRRVVVGQTRPSDRHDAARRQVQGGVADAAARGAVRAHGAVLQGGAWKLARLAASRVAARGAARSTGQVAARAIPLIGGVVGGGIDAAAADATGRRAIRRFLPPKISPPTRAAPRGAPSNGSGEDPGTTGGARSGAFDTIGANIGGFLLRVSGEIEKAAVEVSGKISDAAAEVGAMMSDAAAEVSGKMSGKGLHGGGGRGCREGSGARVGDDAVRGSEHFGTDWRDGGYQGEGDGLDFGAAEARWGAEAERLARESFERAAADERAHARVRERLFERWENEAADGRDDEGGGGGDGVASDRGDVSDASPAKASAGRAAEKARRWANHEAKWDALLTSSATSAEPIGYDDIPWPPSTRRLLAWSAKGCDDAAGTRATYRRLLLRWHPDKFSARFAHRLADEDKERVLERVTAIAQAVKEQWGRLEGGAVAA